MLVGSLMVLPLVEADPASIYLPFRISGIGAVEPLGATHAIGRHVNRPSLFPESAQGLTQ
jgi:hypothetical protein